MKLDSSAAETMAELAPATPETSQVAAEARARRLTEQSPIVAWLLPLASLRLTVTLFAMSIFLVFVGTLAQVDRDIWEVMGVYFRTWFAYVELQTLFPNSFFNGGAPRVPGGFWFPGGWLIGGALGVNLLAAHALRFKVQAHGARLAAGLAVIAIGVALTWLVVLGGSGKETIEGASSVDWNLLWTVIKWSLVALWIGLAVAATRLESTRRMERTGLVIGSVGLAALLLWLFTRADAMPLGDSSLRILWQLIKGGLAALVLLAGCILTFRKRAGIVLLHAGVALVMGNELVVHGLHAEGQMQIKEGETVDFVSDIRTVELAVIDGSNPETDDVVVVPRSLLKVGNPIKDAELPFDVEVEEYLPNASLASVPDGKTSKATAGIGRETMAVAERPGAGTDAGGKVDMAAAYVKLTNKKSSEPLGTYLVSVVLPVQKVDVDGKTYDVGLRFKRTYKPYSMRLDDVRFDKYLGTQIAKNYSSDVRLLDPSRGVDRDVHIWMNNPLRFAGETFYQSSYFVDAGREGTVLQVVTNTGWMIPYVACMLVGTGMLAQFSGTLFRFLQRREAGNMAVAVHPRRRRRVAAIPAGAAGFLARWFPAAMVLVFAAWIVSLARAPQRPLEQMQIEEFGRLPVVYEGRVKPLDTVARNMLRYLSNKQTFLDETGDKPVRAPAIKWMLDVIARPDDAFKHKVFRIENLELLETLGLPRREGFTYSLDEFHTKLDEIDRQAALASSLEPEQMTTHQKKLLELVKKLRLWRVLNMAFDPPQLRPDHVQEDLNRALTTLEAIDRLQPPLAVPPDSKDEPWRAFASAWFEGLKARARNEEPNPAMISMTALIVDYSRPGTDAAAKRQNAEAFNRELATYEAWLGNTMPEGYSPRTVGFEEFINTFEPFYGALVIYVVAFVLVALGWLGWTQPLHRAAFWLVVLGLVIHTFALGSRIYISGRPPVTNLYSSAVFIGWGGVVLGLILERIYRLGIGTAVASIAGFATLLIANFLAGLNDGDTLGVLQAVLDTQFWLATHVVCITLGYMTTFIAGLLGVLYILRGTFTRSLTEDVGKDLARMIYGTVCFAMFFSFVGTVLGGLWADDSWGRFWGWDPKENGALIIVIWNALVLHARWGAMVKDRGLAALAVGGNIVTSWSWFGVNELGVGLHSYGFTEGVLKALGLFVLSQLVIIGLALLPRPMWQSGRPTQVA